MLIYQTSRPCKAIEGWEVPTGWTVYTTAKSLDRRPRTFWPLGKPDLHVMLTVDQVKAKPPPHREKFVALDSLALAFAESFTADFKKHILSRSRAIDIAIVRLLVKLPDWAAKVCEIDALLPDVDPNLASTVQQLHTVIGDPPYETASCLGMNPAAIADCQDWWRSAGLEPSLIEDSGLLARNTPFTTE